MTTRSFCIIGNSHVACLKEAWSEIGPNHPEIGITFVASRGSNPGGVGDLLLEGRHLVPGSAGLRTAMLATAGSDRIDTAAFDGFILCGIGFVLKPLDARLSSAVRRIATKTVFEKSICMKLLHLLKPVSTVPVRVIAHPLLSARSLTFADDTGLCPYPAVAGTAENIVADHGGMFLAQPADTLEGNFHTKAEFASGSIRLDIGKGTQPHPEGEVKHMNRAFGRKVIAAALGLSTSSLPGYETATS